MRKGLITLFIVATFVLSFAGYNETLAFDYVNVAAATSCPSDKLLSMSCGSYCDYLKEHGYSVYFSKIYDIKGEEGTSVSFSMFYNAAKKLFVTSFRQTTSDRQVRHEALQSYGVKYDLHKNLPGNVVVMKYFYDKYTNIVRPDVIANFKKALNEFPSDTNILFTGHSLGSALTTLAALDAKLSGLLEGRNVNVYAFGSPRVGNGAFADLYNSLLPETYRVIHYNDLSPKIFPCIPDLVNGGCVKASSRTTLWQPYHVNNEVLYYKENMAFGEYLVCQNEDPKCGGRWSVFQGDNQQHLHYFNVTMLCIDWDHNGYFF